MNLRIARIAAVLLFCSPLRRPWRRTAFDAPAAIGPRAAPTAHVQVGALPMMGTPSFRCRKRATDEISGAGQRRGARQIRRLFRRRLLAATGGPDLAWPWPALLLWLRISSRIATGRRSAPTAAPDQVMIYVAVYVTADRGRRDFR